MAYPNQSHDPGHGQKYGQRNSNSHRRMTLPNVGGLVRQSSSGLVHPDTEENVEAQTEDVFLNYVYQSYRMDSVREDVDSTPAAPELVHFTASPISPAAEVGRQLARLGDDINEKYADLFDGMITDLNLSDVNAYDAFASIGRRVFSSGTNWGRIMVLLSFGYRIAMTVLRTQAANFGAFLSQIVSFVVRFLVSEHIIKWIADHGGWRAALSFVPSAPSSMLWLVSGLAAASVLGVIFAHRYWQ